MFACAKGRKSIELNSYTVDLVRKKYLTMEVVCWNYEVEVKEGWCFIGQEEHIYFEVTGITFELIKFELNSFQEDN